MATGMHSRTATRTSLWLLAIAALCIAGAASAQVPPPPFEPLNIMGPDPAAQFKDVKIEQHLDAQVPLDLMFRDETGSDIALGEAMDGKTTILALVYYRCPGLCNGMLNGIAGIVDSMKYEIGDDYNVVSVSIDPNETAGLANDKKTSYLEKLHRDGAAMGWHFLTGDEDAIRRLATTVGFRYAYDPATDQYAHAGGIMVLTPHGRIARYYFGVEYIARDVEFGLVEASQGRIGNIVDQLTMLCFQYDPATGKYGFYVIGAMRILAGLMLAGFVTMYAILFVKSHRAKRERNGGGPAAAGDRPMHAGGTPRA